MLRNAMGVSAFPEKKRYECVRFSVISVTRGVGEGRIPGGKALRNTLMAPYVVCCDLLSAGGSEIVIMSC